MEETEQLVVKEDRFEVTELWRQRPRRNGDAGSAHIVVFKGPLLFSVPTAPMGITKGCGSSQGHRKNVTYYTDTPTFRSSFIFYLFPSFTHPHCQRQKKTGRPLPSFTFFLTMFSLIQLFLKYQGVYQLYLH